MWGMSPDATAMMQAAGQLGDAKPISTDWQLVSFGRLIEGVMQNKYICALCGEIAEHPTVPPPHDCPELELVDDGE